MVACHRVLQGRREVDRGNLFGVCRDAFGGYLGIPVFKSLMVASTDAMNSKSRLFFEIKTN